MREGRSELREPYTMSQQNVKEVIAAMKDLSLGEMMQAMKAICTEFEKKSKDVVGAVEKKKKVSTGITPPQLRKNHEWVTFVLAHAIENGWESFEAKETKRGDKMSVEIVTMPGSVLHEDSHVYEGSVTDKCAAGKQLTQKDAMSLSKQYWSVKEQSGTRQDVYQQFLETYEEDNSEESAVAAAAVAAAKPVVVKKTAAEKEAEKALKDAEKAAAKEEKAAEKAALKAEKDAEKALLKAEKEAEKAAAKALKEAAAAAKKAPVKAGSRQASPAAAAVAAPVKVMVPVKKAPVKAKKEEEKEEPFVADEEQLVSWGFKGKMYFRSSKNGMWESDNGQMGAWCGVYLVDEKRIDDSAAEETFDEE